MKIIFLIVILICISACSDSSSNVSPEDNDRTFDRVYNFSGKNDAQSVIQTSDNGYIIVGNTETDDGINQVLLQKSNENGDYEWSKSFSGNKWGFGYSVIESSSNEYVLVGETQNSDGKSGAIVIKTDMMGNLLWEKIFIKGFGECAMDILETNDGNYLIAANTRSTHTDFWLIMLNQSGSILWDKTYGTEKDEFLSSIEQTDDGGFILVGSTEKSDINYKDILVIKTDELGNIIWEKNIGDKQYNYSNSIQKVDDGYLIFGSAGSFMNLKGVITKLDFDGNILWNNIISDSGSDNFFAGIQIYDKTYVTVGYRSNQYDIDALIVNIDEDGNLIWENTFDHKYWDSFGAVYQTDDDGFIIAGNSSEQQGAFRDVLLVKTDKIGRVYYSD